MAFQMTATRPSSSSDSSGSSSSLTPTNNNSLFSSEESRFITDSLTSAESFDPFTIGAPGFKVPNLLPPNLVANQADHQHFYQQQMQDSSQYAQSRHQHLQPQNHKRGWQPATAAMMLPMTTDAGLTFAFNDPSMSAGGGEAGSMVSDPYAPSTSAQQLTSWPSFSQKAPSAAPSDASLPGLNHSRHASLSTPGGTTAMSSGYGKNKAWQLEQLSYLEAAANAAHRSTRPSPSDEGTTSRSMSLAGSLDDYTQARAAAASESRSSTDLAMLGLSFPSSHNFPANDQQQQMMLQSQQHQLQQQHHQRMHSSEQMPNFSHLSDTAAAMMFSGAGLDQASATQQDRSTTPKGQKMSSMVSASSKRPWSSISSDKRGQATGRLSLTPTRSSDTATDANGRGRSPSVRPPWTASSSSVAAGRGSDSRSSSAVKVTDRSVAVSKALAELAHLELDLGRASQRLPATLTGYFVPSHDEKRAQPHLDLLKQQHQEAGLVDENGREVGKEERLRAEALEKEKDAKKTQGGQGHVLLTDAEKKANHIASEQKRRANIRKGYELLCDIVPPLKEALEREAKKGKEDEDMGGGADEDDEEDEDEDEDDAEEGEDGKKKKSGGPVKKKKKKKKVKKKEADVGGCEIDGEKIDGRAGPRSEAVVLMKSLEHISALLERHRALLGRRNRARLALSKAHGVDIAKQSPLDIESLLSEKIQKAFQGPPQKAGNSYPMMQE